MAQLSRVKKYENLRKEIENEKSVSGIKTELTDAKVLNTTKETYTPAHRKSFNVDTNIENTSESNFKNEYLDSFIQEVRQYNIQKGIRESEDTKLDILQQLSSKNREKRSNYISQIEEPVVENVTPVSEPKEDVNHNEKTMEISRQVFELINENSEEEKEEVKVVSSLEEKIAELEKEVKENNLEEKEILSPTAQIAKPIIEQEEISEMTKSELLEKTMELKATVESYKEELSEMNTDISNNNRLLNIIIIILVIALLGVIGVVIYWLFAGGIL